MTRIFSSHFLFPLSISILSASTFPRKRTTVTGCGTETNFHDFFPEILVGFGKDDEIQRRIQQHQNPGAADEERPPMGVAKGVVQIGVEMDDVHEDGVDDHIRRVRQQEDDADADAHPRSARRGFKAGRFDGAF